MVCFNGKCRKDPSVFMSDHPPGSSVDSLGVTLLSFQVDIKLIIFTGGKKAVDTVEENAFSSFFPNTEPLRVVQRHDLIAGEAVQAYQSVYTQC